MTDEDILAFTRDKNPNATSKDVIAFRNLMCVFDCDDAETPKEAHEKIIASIDALLEDIQGKSEEEKHEIISKRLAGIYE